MAAVSSTGTANGAQGPSRLVEPPVQGAFDRIARLTAMVLRAPIGVVSLVADDRQRLIGRYGVDDIVGDAETLPAAHGLCPFRLTASEPYVIEDIRDEPALCNNASAEALGLVAYAAAALVVDGKPLGTVCAVDRMARPWSARDQELLAGLAAAAAAELRAQTASERLEHQAHQLRELAAVSNAILRSGLAIEELMAEITRRARSIIGAHQSVSSLTVGSSPTQWITAVDLSDRYAAWRSYQVQPDGSGIYAMVPETRRSVRMTQEELLSHPRWRNFGAEVSRHPPMRGWLAAPFLGREGQCLGLIQLSDKYEGDFTAEDEAVIVQLANVSGCAVEEAYMVAERDHIANALHASLLPERLPEIPGVELVARWGVGDAGQLPVREFYDVCETPDGGWAVTVADISGTGPRSTATAALVRNTLRALVDEHSPAAALARLNGTMLRERDDLRFATVVHTRLRFEDAPRITVACAGHTAPILLRPEEEGRPLGRPGKVVGAIRDAALDEVDVELRAGDTLVFYTSGVVEAWRGDRSTVMDLADGLTALSTEPPEAIADALEATAHNPMRRGGGDFAILILRLT
jgi:GAF domain-containing protein